MVLAINISSSSFGDFCTVMNFGTVLGHYLMSNVKYGY